MKRSPFYPEIAAHQPSVVTMQGWEVANVFTTAAEEHAAVRQRVGLLDWSTTGEFEIQGPDALEVVQKLVVNDARMPVNRVLYTSILDEDGGMRSEMACQNRTSSPHGSTSRSVERGSMSARLMRSARPARFWVLGLGSIPDMAAMANVASASPNPVTTNLGSSCLAPKNLVYALSATPSS